LAYELGGLHDWRSLVGSRWSIYSFFYTTTAFTDCLPSTYKEVWNSKVRWMLAVT
jgi:hypothetical protein